MILEIIGMVLIVGATALVVYLFQCHKQRHRPSKNSSHNDELLFFYKKIDR